MRKIVIITICQDQLKLEGKCVTSLLQCTKLLNKEEVEVGHIFLEKGNYLQFNLNNAINKFLEEEEITDFVFLDSDIVFNPTNLKDMIIKYEDKRVMSGSYKTPVFQQVPELSIEFDIDAYETMEGEPNLIKVNSLSPGFFKVNRKVLEENNSVFDKIFLSTKTEDGKTVDTEQPFYFTNPKVGDPDYFKGSFYQFFQTIKKAGEDLWCHLDFDAGKIDGNFIHHYALRQYIKMKEHLKNKEKEVKEEPQEQVENGKEVLKN